MLGKDSRGKRRRTISANHIYFMDVGAQHQSSCSCLAYLPLRKNDPRDPVSRDGTQSSSRSDPEAMGEIDGGEPELRVFVACDPCVGAARSFLACMLQCDGPANSILVLCFSVTCNPSLLLGRHEKVGIGNCIKATGC
jgi:hypothetical protein